MCIEYTHTVYIYNKYQKTLEQEADFQTKYKAQQFFSVCKQTHLAKYSLKEN